MGLTLQFAIGNRDVIIDAIKNFDLDYFDNLETQNNLSDFSLHLIPNDLNFLVNSATELKGIPIFGLREYLDTEISCFDSEERGGYLVNPIIKVLFSDFEIDETLSLTKKWFDKMNLEYNDNLEVTDDAISAVKNLVLICKDAESLNLDLVHFWYL